MDERAFYLIIASQIFQLTLPRKLPEIRRTLFPESSRAILRPTFGHDEGFLAPAHFLQLE